MADDRAATRSGRSTSGSRSTACPWQRSARSAGSPSDGDAVDYRDGHRTFR